MLRQLANDFHVMPLFLLIPKWFQFKLADHIHCPFNDQLNLIIPMPKQLVTDLCPCKDQLHSTMPLFLLIHDWFQFK